MTCRKHKWKGSYCPHCAAMNARNLHAEENALQEAITIIQATEWQSSWLKAIARDAYFGIVYALDIARAWQR